jgi:purine-nucleoside phosphorylase
MKTYRKKVEQAVDFLKVRMENPPVLGIVTGTGLGDCLASIRAKEVIEYKNIPNTPHSTVESHAGRLIIGTIEGLDVVALQGRFHLYEGYPPRDVTFLVRVLQMMGTRSLILTNAAGGLNLAFQPGDIMMIRDHINLTGENPLVGPNEDSWGVRFPDMTAAYDRELMMIAENAARQSGQSLQKGVYAGLKGPSLETSAETRFLGRIGADAVGFSTVMEAICAVHAGMKVLGLSIITNINDPDHPTADTEASIVSVARKASSRLSDLIRVIAMELKNNE